MHCKDAHPLSEQAKCKAKVGQHFLACTSYAKLKLLAWKHKTLSQQRATIEFNVVKAKLSEWTVKSSICNNRRFRLAEPLVSLGDRVDLAPRGQCSLPQKYAGLTDR